MPRRKMMHYEYCDNAENIIQAGKPLYTEVKGKWNTAYFQNDNPLVVELACGKGEYTVGLAQKFPDKNFIGMDIKGDRIARGSRTAVEASLSNVAFLRAGIQYADEFFEKGEVDEIWLVHPDPQVRDRDEPKRLANPNFLKQYAYYLKAGGSFCLKTDSDFLYHYALEMISEDSQFKILDYTDDLYSSPLLEKHHGVKTHYEKIFVSKGYTIKFIECLRL
ncbi:tRNA (guanine-N7-)-methyltransferase [Dyadobacter jejuensis]|uniref:tRNA (guanine-N(7)-)-methyltransferase n=1 Tax=Dyadobacter jejuensis TaxID=1082580 RepID=A0A316AN32_9BACT|nr:tRNA (guanosine(46)-N7)-methyltransferase TrmB [Dyadobacter jejuensis]PWJ58952.1 tRNA (guanine-N7-)-methyltransferase [Dyadobacter jejuensis]